MTVSPFLAVILVVNWNAPGKTEILKQDFSQFKKLNFIYYGTTDPEKGDANCKKVLHRTVRPDELKNLSSLQPKEGAVSPFTQAIKRIEFDVRYQLSNARNVVVVTDGPVQKIDSCHQDPCAALKELDQTLGDKGRTLAFQMVGEPVDWPKVCRDEYQNITWKNEFKEGDHPTAAMYASAAANSIKGALADEKARLLEAKIASGTPLTPAEKKLQAQQDAKDAKERAEKEKELAKASPSPLASASNHPMPNPSASSSKSLTAKLTLQGSPMRVTLKSLTDPSAPGQKIGPPPASVTLPAGKWMLQVTDPAWLSSIPSVTLTLKQGEERVLDLRGLLEANWIDADPEKPKRIEIKLKDGRVRKVLLPPGAQPLPVPKSATTEVTEVEAP
jgi:hypothetical protein